MKTTRDKISELLLTAGCGATLYESEQLSNVMADTINKSIITAMVIEPTSGTINIAGGGAVIRFNPWKVEILRMVEHEQPAEKNIIILGELLEIARIFVQLLGKDGTLGKIGNVGFTKVQETRYDANAIGWAMLLSLSPINYESNC